MRRPVRADDQHKIRNVSGRCPAMVMASRGAGKMRSRGLEIRPFALGCLMNVNGMLSRRQILDIQFDSHPRRSIGQSRGPDALS